MGAGQDDLPGHRQDRFRGGGNQSPRRQIAFSDPGALVKQARRRVKRLDIDLHDRSAELLELRQRCLVQSFRSAIAEKQPLSGKRYAKPQTLRHRPSAVRQRRPGRHFGDVRCGDNAQHGGRIINGEGEYGNAIEGAAGRDHARIRDEAAARLQADDVGKRGRHAARSRRIGAKRKRHEACTDRQGGAGAGAPRNELGVKQIATDAVRRAHADQPGSELIEVGFAEDERTCLAQPGDAGGIPVRTIQIGRTARRCRQAFHVDIVLDGDRDPVQGQRGPAGLLQGTRFGEKFRLVAKRDEKSRIVVGADARKAARDDVLGPKTAAPVSMQDLGDRFGHSALRVLHEKRPRNRFRGLFCAKTATFRNGHGLPFARARPEQAHRLRATGPRPILFASFSVIADDVSGFVRKGGRSTEENCIWLSPH